MQGLDRRNWGGRKLGLGGGEERGRKWGRERKEERKRRKGKLVFLHLQQQAAMNILGLNRENTVGLCRGSNKKGKNVVASPNLDVGREGEKSAFNSWL